MTTLVTGASGLVGGHIARMLHARGERLRLLLRPHSSREGLMGVSFEAAVGDVRDPESLRKAMEGVDQVVHAAAVVRIDPFAPERMRATNVDGTANVLRAARAAGVRRLLYVSSTAAVGGGPLDQPADESAPWRSDGKGPYWTTKREAEELVRAAARRGEVDAVIVNPSYVFGSHDVKPGSGRVLLLAASGLLLAYPDGGMGFVNATDVARGALLALEKGRTGERYILSGENLTFRQMLTQAAQEAGRRPPLVPLPRTLAVTVGRVGDVLGPRFPRVFQFLNTDVVGSFFETAYVSNAKACRELGFAPRPVREGIRAALEWFWVTGRLRRAGGPRRAAAAERLAA